MENVAGLLGLSLDRLRRGAVPARARLGRPRRSRRSSPSCPQARQPATYWYYAIALFGAAMTPYEVFFFSSGRSRRTGPRKDLGQSRANVLVGFPLGGLLSLAIAGCAADRAAASADRRDLALAGGRCRWRMAGGKLGARRHDRRRRRRDLRCRPRDHAVGGYTLAQFFGWSWGKFRRPAQAARFHLLMIVCLIVGGR